MKYINKNLLDTDCSVIMHGCNCIGVMGAGVALAIRKKWPIVYDKYVNKIISIENGDRIDLLGTSQSILLPSSIIIVNLFTQYATGGNKPASYIAIVDSIRHFMHSSSYYSSKIKNIAIPRIGCGLGGLKWEVVEELLLELENDYPPIEFIVHDIERVDGVNYV